MARIKSAKTIEKEIEKIHQASIDLLFKAAEMNGAIKAIIKIKK